MEESCGHSDEFLCSIKCWELLDQVHNWQLLKVSLAPWSQLICLKTTFLFLIPFPEKVCNPEITGVLKANLFEQYHATDMVWEGAQKMKLLK